MEMVIAYVRVALTQPGKNCSFITYTFIEHNILFTPIHWAGNILTVKFSSNFTGSWAQNEDMACWREALPSVDILTCHSKKSTGRNNQINYTSSTTGCAIACGAKCIWCIKQKRGKKYFLYSINLGHSLITLALFFNPDELLFSYHIRESPVGIAQPSHMGEVPHGASNPNLTRCKGACGMPSCYLVKPLFVVSVFQGRSKMLLSYAVLNSPMLQYISIHRLFNRLLLLHCCPKAYWGFCRIIYFTHSERSVNKIQ